MLPPVATPGMTLPRVFPGSFFTFEFEQLVSQFWTRQLVDAVRNRVLVVERLTAGVHDGGAVQQGDVAFAVVKKKEASAHLLEWRGSERAASPPQTELPRLYTGSGHLLTAASWQTPLTQT